jgi:hypothetical protein
MIRVFILATMALALSVFSPGSLRAEGSYVAFMAPGAGPLMEVYVTLPAPARCARIASWRNGASGHERHPSAQAVSVVIAETGGRCGKPLLTRTFLVAHKRGYGLMEIFYVTKGGRLIFSELIEIE